MYNESNILTTTTTTCRYFTLQLNVSQIKSRRCNQFKLKRNKYHVSYSFRKLLKNVILYFSFSQESQKFVTKNRSFLAKVNEHTEGRKHKLHWKKTNNDFFSLIWY